MSVIEQKSPPVRTERAELGKSWNQTTRKDVSEQEETTLGWSVFDDGIYGERTISDIRNQLELKLSACLATGGSNGFSITPDRVRNPLYRQLVSSGMLFRNWSVKDLTECAGPLQIPAEGVLVATLESPEWGADDATLFRLIEKVEWLRSKSRKGGRTL